MIKTASITSYCIVLFVVGCHRSPKYEGENPLAPSNVSEKAAVELADHSHVVSRDELSDEDSLRHSQLRQIGGQRHGGLTLLCDLKKDFWGFVFLDEWDEKEKSHLPLKEKLEMEVALKKMGDEKCADYRAEVAAIAELSTSPEASKLDSEAEASFNKWSDRYPQGSGLTPTREDLKEVDRVIGSLFARVKKLPKVSSAQIATEISALPPPKGPGPLEHGSAIR